MAVTGVHLLLIVILVVGPAFLSSRNPVDDMEVIEFIPMITTDKPFSNPGAGTPAPSPKPPEVVQRPPQQPQPQPQPVVQPPPPRSQPQPARVEKVETPKPLPTVKNDPDPVPAKPEPPKRQLPKVSTDLVTRKDVAPVRQTTRTQPAPQPDASKDFTKAAQAIRNRASSSTEIEMPQGGGGSGPAYANYAQLVKSRYTMAWNPPDGIEDEDATVKVSVTIARDGTVISARVTQSSGNAAVDRSVRATLDRVTFIAPFPEGSKDTQRSYIINFNLKAKLQLG